jgi:multicomponent Na+:H+ antiporter subunit E
MSRLLKKILFKLYYFVIFVLFIIWEIITANFKVARDVLRPKLQIVPGVIAVPLELDTDLEITIIANLISLTPGTLSLDVSEDKKFLFVHTMYADDIEHQRKVLKHDIEEKVLRLIR